MFDVNNLTLISDVNQERGMFGSHEGTLILLYHLLVHTNR